MRRLVAMMVAAVSVAVLAQDAAGQCEISVLEMNGVVTLCAVGGDAWQWTGPGGFTAVDPCVDVTVNGTYTLRTFDSVSGLWSDPCSVTYPTGAVAPVCAITGPDTVCAGASATWCGSSGNYTYQWTGPNAFSAQSACVQVQTPGDYTLTLTDVATGIAGAPCLKTLVALTCVAPKVHPSCPAPPRWWSLSCGTSSGGLSPTDFARVAAEVDARSAVWDFGGTRDGLCALLQPASESRESVAGARRQYAAVLANVAAARMGVIAADGRNVGLDPEQVILGVRGVPAGTTLGEWISRSEASLVAVGATLRSHSAHETCKRIERQGRAINRGSPLADCRRALASQYADADDDAISESLESTSDSPEPQSGSTLGMGDARQGGSNLRLSLGRSEWVELRVLDISGRSVRHLVNGVFAAGAHDVLWDGHDDDGRAVRTGAYFVSGRIGNVRMSQRLLIVR